MSTNADWLGEERHELAVERILEGATQVFARDGIQGARMGKIAEAAGCARATLYRYFPNKEALLQAYVDHVARQFDQVLAEKLEGLGSMGERLVEAVATSIELIESREDLAPFFSEEGLGLTAQLAANAASMRDRLSQQIEVESCSGDIRGTLREGVSSADAAEWLTRAILSFTVLPGPPRSGAELRDFLSCMLIPALLEE